MENYMIERIMFAKGMQICYSFDDDDFKFTFTFLVKLFTNTSATNHHAC
jgi:pterin-4a-carbinolamine dehydratase